MTTAGRSTGGNGQATPRARGRPAISLNRIISTALEIVDEQGAEALSMRTLAQRLGSGTATLYRHFDNRAALIAHVVDRFFGEVELDAGQLAAMDWREACHTVARTTFDTLARHRNLAPLLAERIPLGPNAMAQRELCIAFLLGNGFPPPVAAHAYALLARYVLGFAIQLTGHDDQSPDESQAAAVFRASDPTAFPATTALADLLPVPLHEEFTFGLDMILSGLQQLLEPS